MPSQLHPGGGHLRRPGACGRSSGSGSGPGGRGRPPRSRRRAPQLRQCLESAACCELGQRLGVVLDAEVDTPCAVAAEVGHQRVVGVQHEASAGRRARPPARPSGRPAARARRSGRAGRGRGWRAAEARLERRAPPAAARPRRPRRGRAGRGSRPASSSAVATPHAMFEPARLCTTAVPARSSAAAIIAAVVVLPFVAETSTAPSRARADMRAERVGREPAAAAGPGAVVPPLRPMRRGGRAGEPGERAALKRGTSARRR